MISKRIGVVMGGRSKEREASLRSGAAIADALEGSGQEVIRIELEPGDEPLNLLQAAQLDIAFMTSKEGAGEASSAYAVLGQLGVAQTGATEHAHRSSMDKLEHNRLLRLFNVPTPSYYEVPQAASLKELKELHGSFGYPVWVKPRRALGDEGICLVENAHALEGAVERARSYDSAVVIERRITGQKISVGILNGRILGAAQLARSPHSAELDDAPEQGQRYQLVQLDEVRFRGVLNLALRAAEALGASSAVQVDLVVTERENEYVVSVETLPELGRESAFVWIAKAAGYSLGQLCQALLSEAQSTRSAEEQGQPRSHTRQVQVGVQAERTPGEISVQRAGLAQVKLGLVSEAQGLASEAQASGALKAAV